VLIHSDLGQVEWKDSLPTCERLAARLGLELIVVRRQAGGMLERWQTRWANNVARYANLECVKLILPWSTASMRFCTSELKTAIICRELVRRFPGQTILSVSGIRREESTKRKLAPIVKVQPKLTSTTHATSGYDWHPLLDWTKADVFALHERTGFPLHEAYRVYGSSRVSCAILHPGQPGRPAGLDDVLRQRRDLPGDGRPRDRVNLQLSGFALAG
jgi:3'-phosphoadenosine 5'-phosphosulfate sulfotransferase (PAPS reductase)/FAD synthetase